MLSLLVFSALDPDIFVLDEPTTGMDAGTANTFYELMHHSAHNHGKSVLMITHDPEEVKEYTDRNIHLVRNRNCLGVVSISMKRMERSTNMISDY